MSVQDVIDDIDRQLQGANVDVSLFSWLATIEKWRTALSEVEDLDAVLMATVNIDSEAILAYDPEDQDTWPVVMPALTGRKYYLTQNCVAHFRAGETPYDIAAANIQLYSPTEGDWGWNAGDGLDFTSDVDVYSVLTPSGFGNITAEGMEGTPIILYLGSSAFAEGDGTITIRVFYTIIDGSPE